MGDDGFGYVIVIAVAFMAGVTLVSICSVEPLEADVRDLGNAICSVQQNSTFESYEDGILTCSEKQLERYDGIKININRGVG